MKDIVYLSVLGGIVLIFLILYMVQNSKIKALTKKYNRFMQGKDGENFGEIIQENFEQMDKLEISHQNAELRIEKALGGITSTFHKLGIVKYDAFKEMGGNLSFALCLLDDNNTGFILNTMHGRDSSYTYIKEIIKGEAYATLGEEEKESLEKAMNS